FAEADAEPSDDLLRRTTSLLAAMRRAGFAGREVTVGLPASVARMQVTRMAPLSDKDAADAVAWEASERLGISHESIVAASVATGAHAQAGDAREERILVGMDRREVDGVLDALLSAGYEPVLVEPRFASIARALSRRTRRDADAADVRAVLFVDHASSTVLVLRGSRVAFCREIAIGGKGLDEAVAARLSVSVEQASALRARRCAAVRGDGPAVDAVAEDAAMAATRATLDMLAGEVALYLRYFSVSFRGGQVQRIVVGGPHGCEPRLAATVEESCRIRAVDAVEELPEAFRAPAWAAQSMDWCAAFGLAAWSEPRIAASRERAA
ncbi:MAG: pilus assembly protein PilM, partial [Planctomycetota bacterium]